MPSIDDLRRIYDRTSGYCHICHKRLARRNYGKLGRRGAWEVDHSRPRAKGGTDRRNNLYAACIQCNRSKGVHTSRTVRARLGRTKAPLSKEKRRDARCGQAILGAGIGGFYGAVFSPGVALVGAIIGWLWGSDTDPDE